MSARRLFPLTVVAIALAVQPAAAQVLYGTILGAVDERQFRFALRLSF